jgi:thiamine biosynthesis lipoprotein
MAADVRFRAMGSDVQVVVVGGPAWVPGLTWMFVEDLEARWSRFRPDSEVSRMNALAGQPVQVSGPTLRLVELALEGARITGGRFDPTVLGAVVRAGYERDFGLLTEWTGDGHSTLSQGYERVELDPVASTVTLPRGVGFDPGGIGKGLAADLLVEELMGVGVAGACANAGGDLRVEGSPPDGESWTVRVEHPLREEPAAVVGLHAGAVATSTRARRTWGPATDRRHHLIDPSTGRPAQSGLLSATVIAARAWQAEVLANGAFVSGLRAGLELLRGTGTDGVMVDDGGAVHRSLGLNQFTGTRRDAWQDLAPAAPTPDRGAA